MVIHSTVLQKFPLLFSNCKELRDHLKYNMIYKAGLSPNSLAPSPHFIPTSPGADLFLSVSYTWGPTSFFKGSSTKIVWKSLQCRICHYIFVQYFMILWFIFNCKIHPGVHFGLWYYAGYGHLPLKISCCCLQKPSVNKNQKPESCILPRFLCS